MKRRELFTLGAAAGAAALVSPVATAVPVKAPQKWDESYDVVIIGAGGAGLAAACEAVMNKLSAAVFEKEPTVGGLLGHLRRSVGRGRHGRTGKARHQGQ